MKILNLLDALKIEVECLDPVPKEYLISKGNQNGFEKLVPTLLDKIKLEDSIQFEYEENYGHHFPDLDIKIDGKTYGVELKSRNNGSFDTNGNSVFENISDGTYEEIYVFFGTHNKKDTNPKIKVKYLPYWQATSSIVVTHSPRFRINMSGEKSVFKSQEQYNLLRSKSEEDKVEFLQEYLRSNIEGTRWFISKKSTEVSPISLNTLTNDIQKRIVCEVMILFPQDIFKSMTNEKQRSDYTRSSEYIINQYFYFSSSFRDFFSSGGVWNVGSVSLPKVFKKLEDHREDILEILNNASTEFKNLAYHSWEELDLKQESEFKDDYFRVLDYLGNHYFKKTLKNASIKNLSSFLI